MAALGYARKVLGVKEVRTHHLMKNWPILAIDRALGYVALEGVYKMEKRLTTNLGTN